ncbi:hypothetical protein [Streptomyces sp. NPDC004783]|uniref:hypothetical protein n=1 Tax=Streptomyces sp. NPDC004783 TaxID=3154459 RepID=UPI0033AEC942
MTSYSSLTRALAEVLVDVLCFIEGSVDEQLDQDDAVKVLEGLAHRVSSLPSDQRQELVELVGEMTAAETDPARRNFLEHSRKASDSSTMRPEHGSGHAEKGAISAAERAFRTVSRLDGVSLETGPRRGMSWCAARPGRADLR